MGWDESRRDLYRFAAERIMQFGKDLDEGELVEAEAYAVAVRVVAIAEAIVDEVRHRAADDFEQMLQDAERKMRDAGK